MLGRHSIVRGKRPLHGPSALVRVEGEWRIMIARSLPDEYALFAIAHELGHWLIGRHHFRNDDEERAADYLAGALLAPRRAFLAARRALGDDLPALSSTFRTTETGAALRLGEVTGRPLAVISPARVRVRGPSDAVWPPEGTLRQWARRPVEGTRRVVFRDDPRRVMLDLDERFEAP
ncbi:ImmA/IrrE family metallo-endopeptidase [Labilithrix luteola]|uniref:ImmA/IrrE family metallo-endopeptidase n=1 Tax=Labilithrix luteola TaxID=1391654 RepID=UPI0023DDE49E|nr:ImmA/IrrE family metallo-endopeptidase [Labilithrix luteola]